MSSKRISLKLIRAALGAAGLDAALRVVVRQIVGRHHVGVVHATDDDRLIGIAFQEADDHFLADARNVDRAPGLARPRLRDANPAGAVLVEFAVAIPVELHFHARIFVGVDLLARLADDNGSLCALHYRLRCAPFGTVVRLRINGFNRDVKLFAQLSTARFIAIRAQRVSRVGDQILDVQVRARVHVELEPQAGRQAHRIPATT